MRETDWDRESREKTEEKTYQRMLGEVDKYKDDSVEENIRIGRERFSIRWILYYAEARNAGKIACMYMASMYANDMMDEYHDIDDRRRDYMLLWQADLYLKAQGKKKVKVAA